MSSHLCFDLVNLSSRFTELSEHLLYNLGPEFYSAWEKQQVLEEQNTGVFIAFVGKEKGFLPEFSMVSFLKFAPSATPLLPQTGPRRLMIVKLECA